MHITFLGTGAADWRRTDPGFRAFTSTRIDNALLIDGTMDVFERIGDTSEITDVIYTHNHRDHFDIELLKKLAPVRAHIHKSWAHKVQAEGVEVVPFECNAAFKAGEYEVTALPSNHLTEDWNDETVHFVVCKDGKAVFYATDGAWITTREWHGLLNFELDAAIFDATIGDSYPGDFRIFEHNNLDMVRLMLKTLRCPMFADKPAMGKIHSVIKPGAPVFITHMARTLHPAHEELAKALEGEFVVAYDGFETDI